MSTVESFSWFFSLFVPFAFISQTHSSDCIWWHLSSFIVIVTQTAEPQINDDEDNNNNMSYIVNAEWIYQKRYSAKITRKNTLFFGFVATHTHTHTGYGLLQPCSTIHGQYQCISAEWYESFSMHGHCTAASLFAFSMTNQFTFTERLIVNERMNKPRWLGVGRLLQTRNFITFEMSTTSTLYTQTQTVPYDVLKFFFLGRRRTSKL